MIELRDISKRFGRVQANDRVSFTIDTGTIHAIVGENGGQVHRDADRTALHARQRKILRRPARHDSPSAAIALGIGMVHQHFMLVDDDGR